MSGDAIQSVLQENRQFPPSETFAADAHISRDEQYQEMWQLSALHGMTTKVMILVRHMSSGQPTGA